MELEVGIREDLKDSGYFNEDGEAIIYSLFYLVVLFVADGRQFAHRASFSGRVELEARDDYDWFPVRFDRQLAQAQAERLLERVQKHLAAGGKLDFDHWREIDAAYGSEAWQAQDAGGFFAAREKAEDLEAEAWGRRR